jgi:hypothetical protein
MLYELRTTFTMKSGSPVILAEVRRADRLLRELYEGLPKQATMGADVGRPSWYGNRYNEPKILLEVATRYRNVFGLTADRFRIENALKPVLAARSTWLSVVYAVLRVYGDAELVDPADPSKKASHPC